MYDMTVSSKDNFNGNRKKQEVHPQTPNVDSRTYVNESGVTKDAWFREEDQMRKKLEKQAINQLKNRIA